MDTLPFPSPSPSPPRPPLRFPSKDGITFLPPSSAPGPDDPAHEILRYAETLGIPWRRVLLGEIEAEQRLRQFVEDIQSECPLPTVLKVLSSSFLDSWRARGRIQSLVCDARGASDPSAVQQLRMVFLSSAGKSESDRIAFAEHLRFAHQRILLLQRVRRAAAKSRGTVAERLAFVCASARCCYDDAAWAIREEDSPRRGDRFDSSVRKVREEGFLIPREETEARSLAELRRIVRSSPHLARRTRAPRRTVGPMSGPRRTPLRAGAV
ncbi:MAG TPA: hypothetical protein VF376_03455 [Thermoanaerobaculia bacterium]